MHSSTSKLSFPANNLQALKDPKLEKSREATFLRLIQNQPTNQNTANKQAWKVNHKEEHFEVKKINELDTIRDTQRKNSIYFLFDNLSSCYKKEEAMRLAKVLEAQIFGQHSENSLEYDNEVRKAGNTCDLLSKNRSILDKLQARFICYETLKKAGSAPINSIELLTKDQNTQTDQDDEESMAQEVGEEFVGENPGKKDSPDFEDGKTLENMKDVELRALNKLVKELSKENANLKNTLSEIRNNLLEFSSPAKTVN